VSQLHERQRGLDGNERLLLAGWGWARLLPRRRTTQPVRLLEEVESPPPIGELHGAPTAAQPTVGTDVPPSGRPASDSLGS
jgi:hypothetical protein